MTQPGPDDKVVITPPDKSLLTKIGTVNLDDVFTSGAARAAEAIIQNSSQDFREETLGDVDRLEASFGALEKEGEVPSQLKTIIDIAFSIKANAGLSGYDLISAIAKSLYLYCEPLIGKPLTAKTREIIEWHIVSIRQMVKLDIKGKGGAIGETIMAELAKLVTQTS